MIKPHTISSVKPAESKENTLPASTSSDMVQLSVSSTKKLSGKTNKTDQVLTYLKASMSCELWAVHMHNHVLLFFVSSNQTHACVAPQDKAAADMHSENRIYKRQLIGLLAKVNVLCSDAGMTSSLLCSLELSYTQLCCS